MGFEGGYSLSRGEGTKLPALCQALELLSAHRILGQAQGTTLNLAIRTTHLYTEKKAPKILILHVIRR